MDKIDELLTRGVDKIYPSREELEKVLRSGKKLKLYQGFDPTSTQLHIGHMVGFRKHRQWQDLGHEVIFLIGDGTGQAGDPSGKGKSREKFLTREELRGNASDYIQQVAKIVRFDGPNPIKILYNGDWLNKLTLTDILGIAQHFTVQQMIERDMYQERLKNNESINLREFLYPLLQAYDSVAMDVNLEIGGTDQTFNMLAGRTLMKAKANKNKFVMTLPLLVDSNGVKIGKSEGNVIGLTDPANELFGKIMSLGDDAIISLFTLLTDVPLPEITNFDLAHNPMDLKKRAAWLIISQLHSAKAAHEAQTHFESTFQKKQIPEEIETLQINVGNVVDILVESRLSKSRSEAKRLIDQGGITINGERVDSVDFIPTGVFTIQVGPRKFVKVKLKHG